MAKGENAQYLARGGSIHEPGRDWDHEMLENRVQTFWRSTGQNVIFKHILIFPFVFQKVVIKHSFDLDSRKFELWAR